MEGTEITPEEMEQKKKMAIEMCTCRACPSFKDCGEETAFCFPTIGKSKCITEEKGCICGSCPVTEKMGLKHGYYCIKGSEKEQSGI